MEKFISWVEIPAADFERAVKFYSAVFKLDLTATDCGSDGKMACFPSGEGSITYHPLMKPSENGVLVHFTVPDSIEATIARVEQAGCKVVIPKTKIEAEGMGYFAVCTDSENNKIGLYE